MVTRLTWLVVKEKMPELVDHLHFAIFFLDQTQLLQCFAILFFMHEVHNEQFPMLLQVSEEHPIADSPM